MSIYDVKKFNELVVGNRYPGRGIVVGKTEDGKKAAVAYFIMGRSANSRNRIFTGKNGEVFTEPFDASKVEDPSLIIYSAIKKYENHLIATNGDQTDTIYDGFAKGLKFDESLETRCFEPDAPNFTPRISACLNFDADAFSYKMSILKSANENGDACNRYTYDYEPINGLGHFIHTYECDGNPLPTFQGEPRRVFIPNGIDELADEIWNSLDEENKISLYVRYIDLTSGEVENRLINKNK